jgi:hypothetical protein
MKVLFVIFVLMLGILPGVLATNHESPSSAPTDPTQETTSRFLSAEAQRLIKDEFTGVREELKAYQDENFIALDGEMKSTISRAQQQLVMGSLGAILLGGAIIAIIMWNISKKYSYEKFLEQQLNDQTPGFAQGFHEEQQGLNQMYQDSGVQELQQQDWGMQEQPNPTISQDQGQSFASNTSQFSNWQQQAPHKDGWAWNGGNRQ